MGMVRITPLEVHVRCDWLSGQPKSIQLAHERVPILSLERVRREAAAYPVAAGPRTMFDVETPGARFALTFEHRRRRWIVEALDAEVGAPPVSAAGKEAPSEAPTVLSTQEGRLALPRAA